MNKATLLILLVCLSISSGQGCRIQPQYTLSLQFACRQRVNRCSCEGEVWWNGKQVLDLEPRDYQINTASVKVQERAGQNVLEIKGKGKADSYGLTIDNVRLVRDGTNKNLVINGDFERPDLFGNWKIYDQIEGWTGKQFEIGEGKLYNYRWNSQVCELDAHFNNAVLRQTFILNDWPIVFPRPPVQLPNRGFPIPPVRLQKVEYALSFDWAPRTNGNNNLASSKGTVWIGNQKIADLQADSANSGVRHSDFLLALEPGPNSLSFRGVGQSDSYGLTVTNVILRRENLRQNVLINGDFSSPFVGLGGWQYIRGGIKGWEVEIAEVGDCRIYNNSWQVGQCIELDSTANQVYTQKFTVERC